MGGGFHTAHSQDDLAYHNKSVLYSILFKAVADTLLTIAADPKHLGCWGQASDNP